MPFGLETPIIVAIIGLCGGLVAIIVPLIIRQRRQKHEARQKIVNSFWLGDEIATVLIARYAQAQVGRAGTQASPSELLTDQYKAHVTAHIEIVSSKMRNLGLSKNISDQIQALLKSKLGTSETEVDHYKIIRQLISAELRLKFGEKAEAACLLSLELGFLVVALLAMHAEMPKEALVRLEGMAGTLRLPKKRLRQIKTSDDALEYLRDCGEKLKA